MVRCTHPFYDNTVLSITHLDVVDFPIVRRVLVAEIILRLDYSRV